MKIAEYNQMMKYLTRPAEPEDERIDFATGGPVMKRFLKNVEKVKKFVAMKKEKGEEIYHSDLLKVTGKKNVSANLRILETAGVMNDITDLSKGGRGVKQTKIQPFLDQAVDDFYTGKRPINEMRTSSLIPELSKKAGLEKNIGQRNLTKLLMKNPKYVEMIPVRDSVTQSVTKQKGPVKEKLMKLTFQEAKTEDVVAKARPGLPQPKGVEDSILRDLRRYSVQNKNKGALFQIIEDSKSYNQLKIFDAEAGETLDKGKIIKYIKQNDPRFQEYVQTFKDVRKIKNKKYGDGTLNDALKKIKRGGVDASIQLGHVDGVGVNPLRNLEPQLAFANQAARAKGADFKQLGLQAPGGEGVPRKLTAEENINRFVKFADRSLKAEAVPGAKLVGDFTQSIIDDVAKGKIASPALKTLGLAGVGYGIYDTGVGFKEGVSIPELGTRFFGLDPVYRYAQEQMSLSPEARKIQAAINRNIAAEAEDVAGLGMFDLQPAKEVTEEEKQILETELEKIRQNRKLLNQQRAQERADLLRVIQDKINNPGATVYRSEFNEGGPGDPSRRKFFKIMGGLASLPILGKIAKPIAKIGPEATEVISRTAEQMPVYLTTLINKIKSIGKSKLIGKPDNPDGFVQYDLEDYTLIEGPGYTRVSKTEYGASSQGEGIKNQLEVEIKKDPETGAIEYDEFTVSPDAEGKLKDVDFGIEDMDHKTMETFANE